MIAERNFSCLCFLKTSLKLCNFFCLFCCSSLRKCCQPWRKLGILQNGMIGAFEPGHHPAGCWWHKILHKRPGLGASLSPLIYSDNCHSRAKIEFSHKGRRQPLLKYFQNLPIWRVHHDAGREKEDDLSANQVTLSPPCHTSILSLSLSPCKRAIHDNRLLFDTSARLEQILGGSLCWGIGFQQKIKTIFVCLKLW